MLYLVQMFSSGSAASPAIFTDQARAQDAYCALVRTHCGAEFTDYCERNPAGPDSFVTARAFVEMRDGKSPCFYYWELPSGSEKSVVEKLPLSQEGKE